MRLWLFVLFRLHCFLLLWLQVVQLFEQGLEPQSGTSECVVLRDRCKRPTVTAWSVLVNEYLRDVLSSCTRD